MAPQNRRAAAGGRAKSAPNMVPVFATLGVVLVAAATVALMNQPKDAEASGGAEKSTTPVATGADIFGDIDTSPERFMRKESGSGKPATTHNAPPGLADHPTFQEARKLAAEATVLVNEAVAAEKAGDVETWRTKGIAGREKFEHIMEMTADWEIELITTWGSNEAQLKEISAEIDRWRKLMTKVRKVH